ncbi:hypothetical protein [Commensalibacter papalotli (ex Servin-Garciduenas et al. 2014)]|uniref:Uncharacterized protein n=1 Tax=Commensalibacter papalotli (ex Servin-Garciduenas et al. 2014) TaxID=1208583 RepID=W7DTZ8_9PROT|nr:hypothetical protein [Commensalibacter papalotli (ex Servin-Garciduenas et al. 2014)]EUK18495.1 hypothetical protein COMX_02065 [Commensalibacter papalotli (ex Servin-Garciduenas et al. 2014)]
MTENPYTFLQKKLFTTSLNNYLMRTQTPCFIVNHFAHIYFIAEIAKKTSYIIQNTQKIAPCVYLLSPPNAITYIGVRWWLSFINKAVDILHQYSVIHILDCFDHAGLAMASLRMGQKHIFFESKSSQFNTIQNRAQTLGATIWHTKPNTFNLLDLNFKNNHLI